MRGRTGEPRAFVSHTWKAPFADLVAAVSFVLQSNDYVWVDIFAVRQWPGNDADLDFDCCIRQAPCFLLVGKHIPEVASLDLEVLRSNMKEKPPLPDTALQWCAFFRVWCLVELDASLRYGKTTLMLIGANDGERGFVPNDGMINNLLHLIDVTKAVASVEADRVRILQDLEKSTGAAALNARAVSALNGSLNVMQHPKVLQAAFGNLAPLDGLIGKVRLGEALTTAAASGFVEVMSRLLLRGAPVSHRDNTPIIAAALCGHKHCIRLLLEHSADIDACDKLGWTPLMHSTHGYEACVRTLISCSADMQKQNNDGFTALAIASQRGQLKCIDALLEAGADLEKADNADWTPLMLACLNGHERCVRRFIERGANIEKQDNTQGFTALMIACQMGYAPCVEALLEAGADREKQSEDPSTALMVACHSGHAACVRMLLEYGADVNATAAQGAGALLIASQAGYEPCVHSLIEHSAIVDQAADDGTTPLMHACKGGHAACVKALLDAGANKDLKTLRGGTATGIAREYGHTALLQLLQ